ncbi:MAG: ABC transporter permease [Eubacterium sp.]|nr:ABC transporter permease [Eubacterium sp.]
MIKQFLSGLFINKGRAALTISSIAVGIFAVAVISAVGRTGTDIISRSLDDMGINSILVQTGDGSATLSSDDVAALNSLDGIANAMPLMSSVTQCELPQQSMTCIAWGVSRSAGDIISLKALHGRLINDSDIAQNARVCAVDKEIALQTYGRTNIVGKTVDINIGGGVQSFEIIGVVSSGLSAVQSVINDVVPYFVYLPYTTVQELCGTSDFDTIALRLEDTDNGTNAVSDIELLMKRRRDDEIEVNNLLSQKQQLDGILSTVTVALSLIAGISLIVSGLSVMNAMLVSVSERRREIGIKKALGAPNYRIVTRFLAESTALTLIGSIIGAVSGVLVTYLGCVYFGEPFSWEPSILLFALCVSAVIGMLSGSYPAYKAAGMKPVDALKE